METTIILLGGPIIILALALVIGLLCRKAPTCVPWTDTDDMLWLGEVPYTTRMGKTFYDGAWGMRYSPPSMAPILDTVLVYVATASGLVPTYQAVGRTSTRTRLALPGMGAVLRMQERYHARC